MKSFKIGDRSKVAALLLVSPSIAFSSGNLDFNWEILSREMGIDMNAETFQAMQQEMLLGRHPYDIYVNNSFYGEETVEISLSDADNSSLIIAVPAIVFQKMPLKREALKELFELDPKDFVDDYNKYIPGVTVELDELSQTVRITIPQIYEDFRQRELMPSRLWNFGEPGIKLAYSLDTSQTETAGEWKNRTFAAVDTQINLGQWRFIARSTAESGSEKKTEVDFFERHATTLLPQWNAKLDIGEFTTTSKYLGGLPILGINLFEDTDQIESTDLEYMPLITGYANSAALVTVRQRGRVLRSVDVPPGPFSFNDIRMIGSSGDIEVEVKEYGGQTRTYIVPFTIDTRLLKDRRFSWSLSAGRYYDGYSDEKPWLFEASAGYGLPIGGVTLYGGLVQSEDFGHYLAGSAFDVGAWGSLSLQYEQTHESINRKRTGGVAELAWHKYFELSESTFDLTYRQTINGNLGSLTEVVGQSSLSNYPILFKEDYVENQLTLTMSKTIGRWGSFAGSYFGQRTHLGAKRHSVNTIWSAPINDCILQLQGQLSRDENIHGVAETDWQISLSLDIPLSLFFSNERASFSKISLQSTVQPDGEYVNQVDVSADFGEKNDWTLKFSGMQGKQDDGSVNAELQYRNPSVYASMHAGYNHDTKNVGFNVNGSVIGSKDFLAFDRSTYGNVAVVHIPEATEARIKNKEGSGEWLVVSGMKSFVSTKIALDPDSLPPNLTVIGGWEREIIPASDAFIKVDFQTFKGEQVVFSIRDRQGHLLPYSALVSVLDVPVMLEPAVVDEAGQAYFASVPQKGTLEAKWHAQGSLQSCRIPYELKGSLEDAFDIHQLSVSCEGTPQLDDVDENMHDDEIYEEFSGMPVENFDEFEIQNAIDVRIE